MSAQSKKAVSNAEAADLWRKCKESFPTIDVKSYLEVEERQINIYETPEGTLFNRDVIDKNMELHDTKNVKRDPSFRTFKEQIEALEAMNEIAKRNREKGVLTARQKKAVDEELKFEQEIRTKLKRLHDSFEEKVKVLFKACKKEPKLAYEHISILYDIVVPLLKSSLVAKIAVQGYLAYVGAFFEVTEDNLHKSMAQSTLRALESKFLLDQWCETPLEEQIAHVFHLLSSACFLFAPVSDDEGEEEILQNDASEEEGAITAAKIAFLVPFLEHVFLIQPSKFDVELRLKIANFLKSAISSTFIKQSEVSTMPMFRLASVLVDAVCADESVEYVDSIAAALGQFMDMLNEDKSGGRTEEADRFLRICIAKLQDSNPLMRRRVLKAILQIDTYLKNLVKSDKNFSQQLRQDLFLARHDPDPNCVELADQLWRQLGFGTHFDSNFGALLPHLHSHLQLLRTEAGSAVRSLLQAYPDRCAEAVEALGKLYKQLNTLEPAEYDNVGRKVRDEWDPWERRCGTANAILLSADCIPSKLMMPFIRLIVPAGLSDRAEKCRDLLRAAAVVAIQNHGTAHMEELLPFLERELNKLSAGAVHDNLRHGLVVLIGTLAQFMQEDDTKIRKIVARLIETLSTPSQRVQEAIAACLPPLINFLRADSRPLMENMFLLLVNAQQYGERRGAAYGIAAIVKGLGVVTIKEMGISTRLKELLAQKQKPQQREGALLCIEMLCSTIGKLFEPYLVHLLPDLLNAFGDSNESVRRTADDTAKAMMRSLSAHGVKLLLPSLLRGLDDDSWRTKCASAELLGAMSNCAPRQLSTSLPSIVPKLCETLTDTHSKVQKASERALKQIAQVIQNPECLAISSHLIQALVDPPGKTVSCLQTIVNNKFVHYVDSPSLALMMPIMYRAFAERNTEARRMAAQIIANIYSLVDHKDMEPYLGELLPGLRKALLDPVPEVRTVAGKALGSIVQYSAPETSEKIQTEIMPWLKENLISKSSSVDRQGAAQGLSEVIAGLGDTFLEQNLPGVIRITETTSTEPHIRDGYILLYIYLPIALGDRFIPYLSRIIPSILKALADETEYVRESALRAGKRLIIDYSAHARKLLLPQLQAALIHENWRIRQASVKLIGDFLFHISGVSGKMTSETAGEDDTLGSENVNSAIVRCIGQRSRDELLAGIYLTRYDVVLQVRQAAGHVWKVIIANTPRTLKDIMRPLFELMLHCLSSSVDDRQQMAVRCLSELVKKMGERILDVVLPILEERLKTGTLDDRRGVALALNEIIGNVHREIVENHANSFVNSIRICLSDSNQSVRDAAGQTFAAYHAVAANVAVEEIVTPMLDAFNQTAEPHILDGLCSIMAGPSGRQLFQGLLPKLARPPVNSLALCRLAGSTDALNRNLAKVMDALLCESVNTTPEEHIQNCLPVLFSLEEEEDVHTLFASLLKYATGKKIAPTATALLKEYIAENEEAEYTDAQLDLLISGLISLYNALDDAVLTNIVDTFGSLVKQIDPSAYIDLVLVLKRAIKNLAGDTKKLDAQDARGLCIPKGWQPLLTVLREGILSGGVEIKEVAAYLVGQLVQLSSEAGLKPHVVNMAGPLIRILGERHPAPVKIAALNALLKLLEKVPHLLKAFLPQMQSVFLKLLQDPSSQNQRQLAAQALGQILSIHPKPDTLLKELNKIKDAENAEMDLQSDKIINDLIVQIGENVKC